MPTPGNLEALNPQTLKPHCLPGIVPVIVSTFWDTWVMPMFLYLLTQAARSHASFSSLDCGVTHRFYVFDGAAGIWVCRRKCL